MFKARLITALFLIGGFLAALFLLPDLYWASLMLGIVVLGAWEWGRLSGFGAVSQRLFTGVVLLLGISLLPHLWLDLIFGLEILLWSTLAAAVFWLVLAPLWLVCLHHEKSRLLLALLGLLLLMPAWLALVHLRNFDPRLVLAVMAVVWIADSAAYISGKAFGKHKLAPAISPGKTWEGVAGAMLAVSVYGSVLAILLKISFWLVVGCWALAVLSIVGDLFESLLKRQVGLKDSGQVLPGHGGVLDRIDGLLPTLPLAAFYLQFPLYFATIL